MHLLDTWYGVFLVLMGMMMLCGSGIFCWWRIRQIIRYNRIIKNSRGHNPPRHEVITIMNQAAFVMSIALTSSGFELVLQLWQLTDVVIPYGWTGLFFTMICGLAMLGWFVFCRIIARMVIKFYSGKLYSHYGLHKDILCRLERFTDIVAQP